MFWDEMEDVIRSHIETQWALSSYSNIQLVFENETVGPQETYIVIDIQGNFPDKRPYGSVGTRFYQEYGIIYYHCFAPSGDGKQVALKPVMALSAILELQTLANVIELQGANPPTPSEQSDNLLPNIQPSGNYYRVSASVPFCLIGS